MKFENNVVVDMANETMCGDGGEYGALQSPPREYIFNGHVSAMSVGSAIAFIRNINIYDRKMEESYYNSVSEVLKNHVLCGTSNEEELPTEAITKNVQLFPKRYTAKPIILRIASGGGGIDQGLALYDVIRESSTPVIAIVHHAYSMGTILSLACDYVYCYPTSKFMIHDGACGIQGKMEEIREDLAIFEKYTMKIIKEMYVNNSNLSEEEFEEIIKSGKDRYYGSDEMVGYGFVDGILSYSGDPRGTEILTENAVINKEYERKIRLDYFAEKPHQRND